MNNLNRYTALINKLQRKPIENGQCKNTGNIGHRTQNEDKQQQKKTKVTSKIKKMATRTYMLQQNQG